MGCITMEKKELIEEIKRTTTVVDFYKLKSEILKHLESKKAKGGE